MINSFVKNIPTRDSNLTYSKSGKLYLNLPYLYYISSLYTNSMQNQAINPMHNNQKVWSAGFSVPVVILGGV